MICKGKGQTHLGAVSMLCEDVGVQPLGSKTELRGLLSAMLFGGWDAAAVYHAGAVQLHSGRVAQETVLKSCEWKGVPAKPLVCLTSKTMSIQRLLCCSYCSYCRPAKDICFSPDLYIIHRPWTSGN